MTWSYLSDNARIRLVEDLSRDLAVNTQVARGPTSVVRQEKPPAKVSKRARPKVWERDILKDIPKIQEWGNCSADERSNDRATGQLVSILTGVISRGRREGVHDDTIATAIDNNISDLESLRLLFAASRVREAEQYDDSSTGGNGPIGPRSKDPSTLTDSEQDQQVGSQSGVPERGGDKTHPFPHDGKPSRKQNSANGAPVPTRWGDSSASEEADSPLRVPPSSEEQRSVDQFMRDNSPERHGSGKPENPVPKKNKGGKKRRRRGN